NASGRNTCPAGADGNVAVPSATRTAASRLTRTHVSTPIAGLIRFASSELPTSRSQTSKYTISVRGGVLAEPVGVVRGGITATPSRAARFGSVHGWVE